MGEEAAGKRWVRRGCIRRGSGGAGEKGGRRGQTRQTAGRTSATAASKRL